MTKHTDTSRIADLRFQVSEKMPINHSDLSGLFDHIEALEAEVERLRGALQSVVNACDQGKLAPLGGPCGMTIEAQIRGSVYNRVPAWPVEEARAALAGDSHDQF